MKKDMVIDIIVVIVINTGSYYHQRCCCPPHSPSYRKCVWRPQAMMAAVEDYSRPNYRHVAVVGKSKPKGAPSIKGKQSHSSIAFVSSFRFFGCSSAITSIGGLKRLGLCK
jgi:hypothetical protein